MSNEMSLKALCLCRRNIMDEIIAMEEIKMELDADISTLVEEMIESKEIYKLFKWEKKAQETHRLYFHTRASESLIFVCNILSHISNDEFSIGTYCTHDGVYLTIEIKDHLNAKKVLNNLGIEVHT